MDGPAERVMNGPAERVMNGPAEPVVNGLAELAVNGPAEPQCSAKGCRADATWQLQWNNPKLHTPDYRKTWLACDEHRVTLGQFLDLRGFLREVTPFGTATDAPIS